MSGPGFNFGTGSAVGGASGFSFGTSTPKAAVTTSSSGFSFSAPNAAGGFKFAALTTTASAPQATASITAVPPTTTVAAVAPFSFNFNTTTPNPTTTITGTGTTLFSGTANPTTSATTTTTTPSLGFGTGGFSFNKTSNAPATVAAVAPQSLGTSTFSLPAPTTSASVPVSGNQSSIFSTGATLSTATTTTTFGASGAGGATNLSMRQLEEKLNKWLVELKEQEERFLRQAAHVNSWDQILQSGHDQVQTLKDTLHTVKSDQSRLEAEIDFIRGQQEELERLLEPLESATNANPTTQLHQGDRQRDNMYYMAQSLDAQLRQMTEDLGKVIDHLNTNSGSWQPNDPVTLVARILSAHMDTLKWVDQNTTLLSQKVEEVSRVASIAGKRG